MPKHQANLDFVIRDDKVWSQYDLDGQLCCRIEVDTPRWTGLPVSLAAVNYCAFRGMLNKSYIYFRGRGGVKRPLARVARLTLGDHPRMAPLRRLERSRTAAVRRLPAEHAGHPRRPHGELVPAPSDQPPAEAPEGLESVVDLGLGREWLAPPDDRAAASPPERRADVRRRRARADPAARNRRDHRRHRCVPGRRATGHARPPQGRRLPHRAALLRHGRACSWPAPAEFCSHVLRSRRSC